MCSTHKLAIRSVFCPVCHTSRHNPGLAPVTRYPVFTTPCWEWMDVIEPGMEMCACVVLFCTFARVNFLAEGAPESRNYA